MLDRLIWTSMIFVLALRIFVGNRGMNPVDWLTRLSLAFLVTFGCITFLPEYAPALRHDGVIFVSLLLGIFISGVPATVRR